MKTDGRPATDDANYRRSSETVLEEGRNLVADRRGAPNFPRISVITAAYNVDAYIGEAIDSVLCQSCTDFEYIIVNDGSTDETAIQAQISVDGDRRVRLISTDHLGACNARNTGLRHARGEFVAFLDGDDRWHRHFLKEQLIALESAGPDVAAVFARSLIISERGRVYTARWQRAGRYDFDQMLIDSCPPRSGSSLLIKKRAFDSAGLFDVRLKSAQDLDMWLRIQHKSDMPYFLGTRKYLVYVRIRQHSISRDYVQRFAALDGIIAKNCSMLRRHPQGMGYIRASVFAFRAGEDEFALRWARIATEGNLKFLLLYSYGWRLLFWIFLGKRQRHIFRSANTMVRSFFGKIVGVRGGILR